MQKWQEIALSAAFGGMLPLAGGVFWLGKLDNRLEQVERRLQAAESSLAKMAIPTTDPVRLKCAQLAEAATSDQSREWRMSEKVKEAMDALGCIRAN